MFKPTFTLAAVLVISCTGFSSSVQAVGMLLPAIQKCEDNGIVDSIWIDTGSPASGDTLPVLMVIANQDFYHAEYSDIRMTGSGASEKLVLSGWAQVGRLNDPRQTTTCRTVTTLSRNPADLSALMVEIATQDTAGNWTTTKTWRCASDSWIVTIEYLVLG